MRIVKTSLAGVLVIEPQVFDDKRGFFMETYHQKRYGESGIDKIFVQDNLSYSVQGTLRGLHYQHPHGQAKLVQVIMGKIFDVAVDIRLGSPTFGRWTGVYLSDENKCQLYIPEGFAHGFCVVSEKVVFTYKCSDFYTPESERGILWSDPRIAVDWHIKTPLLSDKDGKYPCLKDVAEGTLPVYRDKT